MIVPALVASWIVTGVVAVAILHRRGHDIFSWSILFMFLGPIAIPLAISADRHPPEVPDDRMRDGRFDVLVAHDGSTRSADAVCAALELFEDAVTSVTVAAVVDQEAATTVRGAGTRRDREDSLAAVANRLQLSCGAAETVVLYGEPAAALSTFAAGHGFEMIVVPAPERGGGVKGRAAKHLATSAPVPVLVAPVPAR